MVALLTCGLACVVSPAARATPSLGDARQQAAALRADVDRLQVSVEQATEDYDGAQERLGAAVQRYLEAEEQMQAAQQRSSDAREAADAKIRALYESGGSLALYASVLDGSSINDALNRVQLAESVIADSRSTVAATGSGLAQITQLHARLGQLAEQQDALQAEAAAKATHVRDLLARQQAMLAAADQQVRDLVAAQQQARAQAAAQAFLQRLETARAQAVLAGQLVGSDTAPNAVAAAAIAAARTRLGTAYVWGATGPSTFDCSGLTGWAYAQAGLHLPRTAAEQWWAGPHPALADLAPGDLLFWATDPTNPATIHHVALYIGNGYMIAAPHTGTVVQIQRVYLNGYIGAVRPTG